MLKNEKNAGLEMAAWPVEISCLWSQKIAATSPFAVDNRASLSPKTVQGRRYSLGVFLAFVKRKHPHLFELPFLSILDLAIVEDFVAELRRRCRETTVAHHLERLFFVCRRLWPDTDFYWIYQIARRIAVRAPRLVHPLVMSPQLYVAGLEGLKSAAALAANERYLIHSIAFRDALLVAVFAEAPMRLGSLSALRLADLSKVGDQWQVYAQAEHSKTRKPAEYELSALLSEILDVFLTDVRKRFPGAENHDGVWPSLQGCPLRGNSIGRIVGNFTAAKTGTRVSPHGFRRGTAAFIAYADPENIHSARDLLGHHDFRITEKHYLPAAQTRRAGRELAKILESA